MSKGVDYYAFLSSLGFDVDFQFPSDLGNSKTTSYTTTGQMFHGNDQISESDIGVFDHYGLYKWTAKQNNAQIATGNASIAPSTGNISGDSSMKNMMNTPSVFSSGYSVAYGFYDSGPGWGSLTNQDQSYVYVTKNNANWMGDLTSNTTFQNKSFAHFALSGAHDSGMFDTTKVNSIINNASELSVLLGLLGPVIGLTASVLATMAAPSIMRSVINFAMTQKESTTNMLNLGTRYFDFRPGYCYPGLNIGDNNLYHQHSFIPGYPYASFLNDVLRFLASHPTEIVVVSSNFQGFASDSMKPTTDVINQYLNNALQATGTTNTIAIGNKNDLNSSYNDLIAAKKRLIFLNQVGASDDATKYDSYSSSAYETTNVSNIIGALNGMNKNAQANYDYTVLQLQGTANGTGGGIFTSIATMSDASSPLMSTKSMFDNQTYPWLSQNVTKNLSNNQLVIFLNDFIDNALATYSINISGARMNS